MSSISPQFAIASPDPLLLDPAAVLRSPDRLAALARTGLLDAAAEPALDRLAALAATVLRVPVVLVSLVDADRQFVANAVGLPEPWATSRVVPLSHSFCQYVVAGGVPVLISDAPHDSRACAHPAVLDMGVAAYLGVPLLSSDGQVLGSLCAATDTPRAWTAADVTTLEGFAASVMTEVALRTALAEHARAAAALRLSEARYRGLLDALPVIVYEADPTPPYAPRYVSPGVEALLGYPHAEWLARTDLWVSVLHPEDRARVLADTERALAAGVPVDYEYRVVARDGTVRWIHDRGSFVRGAGGAPVAWQGIMADVTERVSAAAELVYQARHDALTGLANRTLFRERLAAALTPGRSGEAENEAVSVLFLDLDDFKAVNDGQGHAAGDALLVAVAERLLDATRGSDTVARLGGDEFAVLLRGIRADEAVSIVVPRVLAALARPVTLSGALGGIPGCALGTSPSGPACPAGDAPGEYTLRVSASVGVARARAGEQVDDVLRQADVAMYRAKRSGKNRAATFALTEDADALARFDLQTALAGALDRGEFRLVYQPIVALQTGQAVGAEALVRWQHPQRGLVGPDVFIPLAEATGLMPALGRWILREACRAACRWPVPVAGKAPTLTVNVSGRQLEDARFLEDVAEALATSGLPAERLVLEVTESLLLANPAVTRARLDAVRAFGVRVAVDDFGTGYSSLTCVRQLPLDVFKIDRAFTQGLASDPVQRALADTVVRLGAALGLRTVAEGVETEADRDALLALGCELGQGYLYARPLAPAALAEFLGRVDAGGDAGSAGLTGGMERTVVTAPPTHEASSHATVLVVDDDAGVRAFVERTLAGAGYRTVSAVDGADALRVLGRRSSGVDLVLSDVLMPELNGATLAELLGRRYPGLPVVLMSGYARGELPVRGGGVEGVEVLAKPVTRAALLEAVRGRGGAKN